MSPKSSGTRDRQERHDDAPLVVRLSDDNDGLPCLCLELVRSLGLKVILDNSVETGTKGWGEESGRAFA